MYLHRIIITTALAWSISLPLMAQTDMDNQRMPMQDAQRNGMRNERAPMNRDMDGNAYRSSSDRMMEQGKTRQQVQQELREAQRTGNLPAEGESHQTLREAHPNMYPKQ